MIELNASLLIGKGWHRECYQHPERPDLCIKVVVNGGPEETVREQAYLRHLCKRSINWKLLPRYLGKVDTSLGQGAVFELIRDKNGEVSKSLEDILLEESSSAGYDYEQIRAALTALRKYLLNERIITMPIKPKNILLQRTESDSFNCYVIDNIGNSEFIPISTYLPGCARRKILRRWNKFKALLEKNYDIHPGFNSLTKEI